MTNRNHAGAAPNPEDQITQEKAMTEQATTGANNSEMQKAPEAKQKVKVWDPLVRIGHWVLAGGFLTAYLTAEENQGIHVWAGYVIAAGVATRLIWGVIGSQHARFANFVKGPGAVVGYLSGLLTGTSKRSLGHNPAGAAMIIALLIGVGGTAISGMALYAVEEGKGPLAGWIAPVGSEAGGEEADDDEGTTSADEEREMAGPSAQAAGEGGEGSEEVYEDIHKAFVNFTLLLIGLHVIGVIASSLAHRENLVRAMITGRKRAED
jgi:cytochrome b